MKHFELMSSLKRENKNMVTVGMIKANILKNSLNYESFEKNEEKQVKFEDTARSNDKRGGTKKINE